MQIAPLGAIFVFGLNNLKVEAFMSKKKNPTSYQFLINTPNPKKSKKRPDPKKTLEKWGLDTTPEFSFNIFSFFLKKKYKK